MKRAFTTIFAIAAIILTAQTTTKDKGILQDKKAMQSKKEMDLITVFTKAGLTQEEQQKVRKILE